MNIDDPTPRGSAKHLEVGDNYNFNFEKTSALSITDEFADFLVIERRTKISLVEAH